MPLVQLLYAIMLLFPMQNQPAAAGTDEADSAETQPASTQPAGTLIEGMVTNSMGGGIAGAKVRLESARPPHRLLADALSTGTGDIQLHLAQPIGEKMTTRVVIEAPGYAPFSQDLDLDPEEDLPFIDAPMVGAGKMHGQVRRMTDNAAVPGAKVRCTTGARDVESTTDRRGRFALEGIERGSAVLVVTAAGLAIQKKQVEVKDDDAEVLVEIEPERPVRIVATRSDGRPAAELLIELMLEPSKEWQELSTDSQGRVALNGVPATTQKVIMRCNGPGYVQMSGFTKVFTLPAARATATAPTDFAPVDIPLEVQIAATIQGKVVDAVTGEPVLGVRVISGREPYGYMPMIWTSQDGTYELGGLTPGVNLISFQHDEHVTLIRECTLAIGQTRTLDASLDGGKPARGRIVDENGQPVASAWIKVEAWNGYATMGMRAMSDKDGLFEFPHAPAGEMEISVDKGGYAGITATLQAGQPPRDLTLKKAETNEAPPARQVKLKIGDAVPDLTMTATDGRTYKLSELKGKHVFIECWASWCGPCMLEIPNVKALRAATQDQKDFVMIGVNLDQDRAAFDKAVKKEGLDWPQVTGANSGAEKAFGTLDGFGIPFMCLIGPDGKLIAQDLRGPGIAEEVKRHLKK